MKIILDDIVNGMDIEVDTNSVDEIFDYLDMLDNQKHTLLYISDEDKSLMVGGGNNKFVVVYELESGAHSYTFKTTNPPGDLVTLVAGGQEGKYDSEVVEKDKGIVKNIVKAFYGKSLILENFDWIQEY